MTCKQKTIMIMILSCLVFLYWQCGCSLFGGGPETDTNVKPVAELETELDNTKKEIDKSKKELTDIKGNVSMFESRLSKMESNIYNLQMQITSVENNVTQHNESLKSLAITAACIYIAIELFKLVRAFVIAKLTPGSTIANFIRGKKIISG